MSDETKTHAITQGLASYRARDRTCPICNDGTRIAKRQRYNHDKVNDTVVFGGEYWTCEKHPNNTDHYQLSPGGGILEAPPRETKGATVPTRFQATYVEQPRTPMAVHRRTRDGQVVPLNVKKTG